MDYYCYYVLYQQKPHTITQLSLYKLWQGERAQVGLRRQVLVRNTLLTCLLEDNQDRMQEESWLEACFNDLQDEEEEEALQPVKDDKEHQQPAHNDDQQQQQHQQHQQQHQQQQQPITAEHQRRDNIKQDATCWRWHL